MKTVLLIAGIIFSIFILLWFLFMIWLFLTHNDED